MVRKNSEGIAVKHQSSINHDYKYNEPLQRQEHRPSHHHHLLLLAGALIGLGIMLGFTPDAAKAVRSDSLATADISNIGGNHSDAVIVPVNLSIEEPDNNHGIDPEPIIHANLDTSPQAYGAWHTVTVKKGDNLALIFSKLGISAQQLHTLLSAGEDTATLKQLYPGDELRLYIDSEKQLKGLVYDIDEIRTLQVAYGGDGFHINTIEHEIEQRIAHASGTIESSLFLAAQKAGLSDAATMELAGIFGWDIDFVLDIREGDSFTIIYEELYLNGEKLRDGNILAAEFVNRNTPYRAIRYTDNTGRADYFAPDGKNMRKAFLRTPVDFTRISSGFSLGRKHPVLNLIRAHKGVDYAAPAGTPVKATGDGKITFRGTKGGYGKTVIIQHGSNYSTVYAHLSGYARGTGNGMRVRQGQIIGYVGSTGLATGPHLHYEFQVNGVHRNPLRVKLPDAAPLAAHYKEDFTAVMQPLIAQLDLLNTTKIALNSP